MPAPGAQRPPGSFYQDPPRIGNQYDADHHLQRALQRLLAPGTMTEVEPDLRRFGERVATDVMEMSDDASCDQPRIRPYDNWGNRIDFIDTSKGWRMLKEVSATEGLVAIAHERRYGAESRVYWAAKNILFAASSGLYDCPLAMTDGAARVLEVCGDSPAKEQAHGRLTSRDPARFWTSGQWMTERAGGSDVSGGTDTVADPAADGFWTHGLSGVKWFSSATDCDMSLALAREPNGSGGRSDKLSLFYVELRNKSTGSLKGIEVMRLKDKLGTRQLPTAELRLNGTPGRLVSGSGRGVAAISEMLNVTRMWNSIAAVSSMRRSCVLAMDYAHRRSAFGKKLIDHPMHVRTLAAVEVETRACTQFVLETALLLGKVECKTASEEDALLLRLLTPVMKMYTAKHAIWTASECMEAIGGQAYIEESGVPRLLRDAQVLPIWEGTTNVLSLDVLRAVQRTKGRVLHSFAAGVRRNIAAGGELAGRIEQLLKDVLSTAESGLRTEESAQCVARPLSFAIAHCFCASLLQKHAAWSGQDADLCAARQYLDSKVRTGIADGLPRLADSAAIVLSQYPSPAPDRYRAYGWLTRARL
eukprot:TRINITY_DN35427_c0_g1_i1.p1 TRINITY_DN35427_c0_g1~~TRINITY_DN35427_c0_g1_i1.p1  ORF type:complete len:588 (+),score=197.19 TRINITY_DN35427_c0_g1_i1:60-1823(+)